MTGGLPQYWTKSSDLSRVSSILRFLCYFQDGTEVQATNTSSWSLIHHATSARSLPVQLILLGQKRTHTKAAGESGFGLGLGFGGFGLKG